MILSIPRLRTSSRYNFSIPTTDATDFFRRSRTETSSFCVTRRFAAWYGTPLRPCMRSMARSASEVPHSFLLCRPWLGDTNPGWKRLRGKATSWRCVGSSQNEEQRTRRAIQPAPRRPLKPFTCHPLFRAAECAGWERVYALRRSAKK